MAGARQTDGVVVTSTKACSAGGLGLIVSVTLLALVTSAQPLTESPSSQVTLIKPQDYISPSTPASELLTPPQVSPDVPADVADLDPTALIEEGGALDDVRNHELMAALCKVAHCSPYDVFHFGAQYESVFVPDGIKELTGNDLPRPTPPPSTLQTDPLREATVEEAPIQALPESADVTPPSPQPNEPEIKPEEPQGVIQAPGVLGATFEQIPSPREFPAAVTLLLLAGASLCLLAGTGAAAWNGVMGRFLNRILPWLNPRNAWFAAVGLFARIDRDTVLEHASRRRILDLIAENPGICLEDLARRSGLSRTAIVYHTRILVDHHLARFRSPHKSRHFYPYSSTQTGLDLDALSQLTADRVRSIAAFIDGTPGSHQAEICRRTGVQPNRIGFHLARMASLGLVRKEARGRRVVWYPTERLARHLAALAEPSPGRPLASSTAT